MQDDAKAVVPDEAETKAETAEAPVAVTVTEPAPSAAAKGAATRHKLATMRHDPEAVREIAIRELPGFGEVMRAESMKITKNAILSRSLAAVEGAVLLVDASQGIQAQTLANLYLAMEQDLVIIPVLNKIDLPAAPVFCNIRIAKNS